MNDTDAVLPAAEIVIPDRLILPCGVCGQHTPFDFTVSDELWDRVVPEELRLGVVCIICFDNLMDGQSYELEFFWFIGKATTFRMRPQIVRNKVGKRHGNHRVSLEDMFPNLNV